MVVIVTYMLDQHVNKTAKLYKTAKTMCDKLFYSFTVIEITIVRYVNILEDNKNTGFDWRCNILL